MAMFTYGRYTALIAGWPLQPTYNCSDLIMSSVLEANILVIFVVYRSAAGTFINNLGGLQKVNASCLKLVTWPSHTQISYSPGLLESLCPCISEELPFAIRAVSEAACSSPI